MINPRFITFEGGEGSGKTTLIDSLKIWLESEGHKVLVTREPGGVSIAESIREVILGKGSEGIDPLTEMLLFAAARREHLEKKVRIALEDGYIVLCDRFVDSSLVYQGLVTGLGYETVWDVNKLVIGDMMPDLTLYLDIPPHEGLARIFTDDDREKNRLDLKSLDFHKKVREGYLYLLDKNPDRIKVVDASGSKERVLSDSKLEIILR